MSALAQAPCPCGYTINFEKLKFCTKKCGRPHLKNLLPLSVLDKTLTADDFYGQLLVVSANVCHNFKFEALLSAIFMNIKNSAFL